MGSLEPVVKANGAMAEDSAVSALIKSVKDCLPSDNATQGYDREKLKDAAYKLTLALETPGDTVQRIAYYPLHTTMVKIANRLKLLHALVDSPTPKSTEELAQTVGADPVLLHRLLRYLVATGMIGESDIGRYEATNITRSLTVPNLAAGIDVICTTVGNTAMALPDFFEENGYRNPTDQKHGPFQDAFHTEGGLFQWYSKHPKELHLFNLWMMGQREGRVDWLEFFPLEQKLLGDFKGGDDAVMFVDVGGAKGHEVEAIKKKFPDLPGKFILQDLPSTIKEAIPVPGMQIVAHDFFTEQPVKGAKCYYLRNILHDWPDTACQSILTQLAAAMTPGYSMLIINEMVLPNKGVKLVAAQRDITMMIMFAATERTEQQWRDMIGKVGLKVESIWTHSPDAESVIVLMKE